MHDVLVRRKLQTELNIDLNQGAIFASSQNATHNRAGLTQTIFVDLNIIMITMKIKSSFSKLEEDFSVVVVVFAKFSQQYPD